MSKERKRTLIGGCGILLLLAVSILIAVFAYWNFTGARELANVKSQLKENGIAIEIDELVQEMPPEEQNFAMTPLIRSAFEFDHANGKNIVYKNPEMQEKLLTLCLSGPLSSALPFWKTGKQVDWNSMVENLSEEGEIELPPGDDQRGRIRLWLESHQEEWSQLKDAAKRPYSQTETSFPKDFSESVNTPVPHLNQLLSLQRYLLLRGLVALEGGEEAKAMEVYRVMRKISDAAGSQPLLIGMLVELGCVQQTTTLVTFGIEKQLWSDASLKEIGETIQPDAIRERAERSINMEMISLQLMSAEFLKTASMSELRSTAAMISDEGGWSVFPLFPDGVWDHNAAIGARLMMNNGILPLRTGDLSTREDAKVLLAKRRASNFLARITVPSYDAVIRRVWENMAYNDLISVACAVERFRLENGAVPNSLEQLNPEFLRQIPADLMNKGKPIQYRVDDLESGHYTLYSIGWNQTDDGGKVEFRGSKRNAEVGDWAWSIPVLQKPE